MKRKSTLVYHCILLNPFISLIFAVSCLLFLGCTDDASNSELIIIDTSKNYPESDLRLSDVAQVKYIPLKFGKDSTIFSGPGALPVAVFHDTIFILNKRIPFFSQILMYDIMGNPLSKIDRNGSGPGEYVTLGNFILDTLRREIYGWDRESRKMLVYNFEGRYIREKYFNNDYFDVVNLSPDYLLGYNGTSKLTGSMVNNKVIHTKKKTVTFIDKKVFREQILGFDYVKPLVADALCIANQLTITKNGLYISNDRSDTIYFVDRNLRLTPRIVDIAPHSDLRESVICPRIETERYIFLSKHYNSKSKYIPRKQTVFYVYDKEKRELFQLKRNSAIQKEPLLLANNYIALTQFMGTQNHNYAVTYLEPLTLFDHYDMLPPELKSIADTLDENDNPVVMLIKFK